MRTKEEILAVAQVSWWHSSTVSDVLKVAIEVLCDIRDELRTHHRERDHVRSLRPGDEVTMSAYAPDVIAAKERERIAGIINTRDMGFHTPDDLVAWLRAGASPEIRVPIPSVDHVGGRK